MQLESAFTVPASIDDAWDVLRDLERIAPCMPGAELTGCKGGVYMGTMRVKVGPITVVYEGSVRIIEEDAESHRAVIEASGREARGTGTAKAEVETSLEPLGDGTTQVVVHTDLDITGRPAQFGRGVMVDVAQRLVDHFADGLADELRTPPPVADESVVQAPAAEPDGHSPRGTLDLVPIVAGPIAKRLAMAAAVILVFTLVVRWLRH